MNAHFNELMNDSMNTPAPFEWRRFWATLGRTLWLGTQIWISVLGIVSGVASMWFGVGTIEGFVIGAWSATGVLAAMLFAIVCETVVTALAFPSSEAPQ